MERALQIDLAKPEAPAQQVLNTALGDAETHLAAPRPNSPAQTAENHPRRSSKGGYPTTTQVRLNPKKPSSDTSPSHSIYDGPVNSLELGKFDATANVVTLQPVDEGFGAWSYVASAFAMYIVIWGEFQSLEFDRHPPDLAGLNRISARFSNISNFPIVRRQPKVS